MIKNIWNTANGKFIQKSNRLLVLNVLRKKGPLYRTDIAKMTGLSLATVSSAINGLIVNGLAIETEKGDSTGGKRPTMIEFNSDYIYVLSVLINEFQVIYSLTDMTARFKYQKKVDLEGAKGEKALDILIKTIESALKKAEKLKYNLLCIGIGVSGIVNSVDGRVLYSSSLQWNDLELKDIVENRFKKEVFVVHDMNAAAFGEKMCKDLSCKNLLYIMIGKRIGAGMIINNKIYEGINGSAVEFGHMSINVDGPRCVCGNYGCLNLYTSEISIMKNICEEMEKKDVDSLSLASMTIDDIVKTSDDNDAVIKEVLKRASFSLAVGITNLINLFNPEVLVINGNGILRSDYYFENLKRDIYKMALKTALKNFTLIRDLNEPPILNGIATIAIEDYFELPKIKQAL